MGIQLDLRKGLELRSLWLLPDLTVSYVFTSVFPLPTPYLPSFSPFLFLCLCFFLGLENQRESHFNLSSACDTG